MESAFRPATPGSLLIGDIVRRNAAQVPTRAAAWLAGRTLSHAELDRAANGMAWSLHGLGVGRGDRVLCWADTCLETIVLYVATSKLGAVFAPLNALYGLDEALPVARLARARLLVSDAAHAETSAGLAAAAGVSKRALLGPGESAGLDASLGLEPGAGRADDFVDPELVETDAHVIFFTSGSTGTPKGVVLSHRTNFLRSFQGVFQAEPERSVCMFPLFHMAGFTLALAAWQTRGEIAFVHTASAEEILGAVQARQANRLYCIPAVWRRILLTDPADWDTSSLRFLDTGTSATPISLLEALAARYPQAVLRVYYGATESGAGASLAGTDVLRKPGSVGLPSPGVDFRLSDEGEICLRSPFLFDGYFDAPEATAEVLQDGWLHSGDLGALDHEGYLSIVGRRKEIIRTGGESVAPAEIEARLRLHPGVDDVAVVGLPDPGWGEIVCAAVVAAAGAKPSLAELQAHCERELAGFKKPRRLELFAALPRTAATGQVQRLLLVEQILARG